ncbi:MAG: hypothetical protein JXR37_01680 [Kiritimatiellae bacterium]|nr:hypothetical protein [Kiritimatiellia bacterium]
MDNTTVWQDILLKTPGNWEMLRYSLTYAGGTCTFSDELEERLQISWQRTAPCPDLERLFSDLRARETTARQADGEANPPPPHFGDLPAAGAWHGFAVSRAGRRTTRAARYFGAAETLVEAAVFSRDADAPDVERGVLASVEALTPKGRRRWEAFGIRAEVPVDLPLAECRCLPADVTLTFRQGDRPPSIVIRRRGFSSVWLAIPLEQWLQEQIPAEFRQTQVDTVESESGHEVVRIAGTRRRRDPLGLLTGGRIRRRDYACHCAAEQRVYHVTTERPDTLDAGLRLRCSCGVILPE